MTLDGCRVLVVDDDEALADVVARYLAREGFEVDVVHDGAAALERAEQSAFDLVVLDLMLPRVDGFEVFRQLRAAGPVPVVMLTARGEEEDRVNGLEVGADDYVTKPFSPRELTARVKAVLRRFRADGTRTRTRLRGGDIELDLAAHEAWLQDIPLALTAKEFDLLAHLMAHPRRAFRREELLEQVWGWSCGDASTVTVHIRRLREKVEVDASQPRHLCTVRGVGYRFEP